MIKDFLFGGRLKYHIRRAQLQKTVIIFEKFSFVRQFSQIFCDRMGWHKNINVGELSLLPQNERMFNMQEDVIFRRGDGTLTAELCCEIDHHTCKRVREKIDTELFRVRPEILILDFSGVGFMDSSGLGLIIGRCTVAEGIGASVRLSGLSSATVRIIRLGGLDKIKNLTIMR